MRWTSNTPCRLWVNGEAAARFDGPFLSCSANQNRKWDLFADPVRLQAGWNHIVAKVALSSDASALQAELTPEALKWVEAPDAELNQAPYPKP